jgi:hypothetical protein
MKKMMGEEVISLMRNSTPSLTGSPEELEDELEELPLERPY